jgi:ketosteroid isomerase-like protein
MSRENVEVVRRAHEAWQRDDLEGWLSLIDSDVEWLTAIEREMGGVTSVYRGHDGMRELWNLWRSEVEDFWIETDDVLDLGGDRALHLAQGQFRGRASGIVVKSQLAMVVTLRDGKIVRSMDYMSHQEALEAVGLRE